MQMHRILLQYQLKVLTALVVLILSFTGGSMIYQVINKAATNQVSRAASVEGHFWRVVAGQESGTAPGPANQLAKDIKDLSPKELREFRGDSNRYGGITDAIGFDPFDESGLNCFECGPLDLHTIHNVELIHSHGLSSVLFINKVRHSTSGWSVTPFGLATINWIGILYVIGGSATLIIGHRLARSAEGSEYTVQKLSDLSWKDASIVTILVSPLVVLISAWRSRRYTAEHISTMQQFFPDQMAIIRDIDRRLKAMPVNENSQKIKSLRDEVVKELEAQTTSGKEVDDSNELLAKLQTAQNFLKGRQEAKKELGI